MVNITREMLSGLYKKQKRQLTMCWVVSIAVWVLTELFYAFVYYRLPKGAQRAALLVLLIMAVLPFVYIGYTKKKMIPSGNGGKVKEVYLLLRNDFMSDSIVNTIQNRIMQSNKYPEKVRLMLLLTDVYHLRDEDRKALDLLYEVDRSGFDKYPDVGMSFYEEIISVYADLGDNGSVLRAYADAERFIDAAAERNYICCNTAASLMINVEKAKGNYQRALELRLMKNEMENIFNGAEGASQQGTPLSRLIKGAVFMDSSELYFLCGDLANAAKYIDIGGPMLTASPAMTEKANRLSAQIRETIGKQ